MEKKSSARYDAKASMEAADRARELRKKIAEQQQLPIGGKATKMGESLWGDRKAATEAFDALQNMRESEAEDMERRSKEAWGGGKKFAKGGSASSRADGCAKRGKTKGTMV